MNTAEDHRHEEPAVFIVNPKAGAGRAAKRRARLTSAIHAEFPQASIWPTEGPRHATALARKACETGARTVVAIGGDGTCHEVVQGLMGQDGLPLADVAFATIPLGTGSDLQKTLRVPSRLEDAVRLAARGPLQAWDVGRATMNLDHASKVEHFINVAGFGANGEVVKRANEMSKTWGGTATFYAATVATAWSYEAPRIALEWEAEDGVHQREVDVMSCFLANGRFCGGGMNVGNGGRPDDGYLDITLLPPDPFLVQLLRSRRLYDGSLARWPGVRQFRAKWLEARPVEPTSPVHIDLDGEQPGSLRARFDVLPGVLSVRSALA